MSGRKRGDTLPSWCANERHGSQPHIDNGTCDPPEKRRRRDKPPVSQPGGSGGEALKGHEAVCPCPGAGNSAKCRPYRCPCACHGGSGGEGTRGGPTLGHALDSRINAALTIAALRRERDEARDLLRRMTADRNSFSAFSDACDFLSRLDTKEDGKP